MSDPEETFATLRARWREGTFTTASNRLQAVAPLIPDDIHHLPGADTAEYEELTTLGRDAISQRHVGAIILSGGMATRFGYDRPKGLYPILDGKSFLQLKIEWLLAEAPDLPILIMTSFATDAEVRDHIEQHKNFGAAPGQIQIFLQDKFPRLTPDGKRYTPADPAEAFAAPGHGDFVSGLDRSGILERFMREGGRYLTFSNVDNLGASLDPAIIGWHIKSGNEMTIEVASKIPGDKGGAPARVNDRVQLVEGFAFPADFNQDSIPVFNTADYVFTAEALTRPTDLPWYLVEKKVDEQPIIQFEHLAGDLSRTLRVGLLLIERDERFIPVKSQDDVPVAQELIRRKQETSGYTREGG